ncbi:MAG: R3H domain-containing nucleic acid-binding protein [Patescibacteria group bacterium]|nr:R3H domain-containing nucleic acid-binding protein [Patescibacteria group bacterium]
MNGKNQKVITETIIEIFDVMGIEVDIEEEKIENIGGEREEVFTVNLSTEQPNLLIGQYGSNLQSLQHLIGVIVRRKVLENETAENDSENKIRFNIDVNGYKKQKMESLVKLAETMADQVSYNKNSVALRPMSSYERKIIHLEISGKKNLATESTGDDLMRRVVIKYVEE